MQTKRDILLPILRWIYVKNVAVYTWIIEELGAIYATISLIMSVTKNLFVLEISQSLRLWYWLFYYMLGGLMEKEKP